MHTIETYEDYASLIKGKHFTLLMFTASWCGPCKVMKPLFKDYAEKCAKDFPEVHFSFVDVDNCEKSILDENKISSIPMFKKFYDSKLVEQFGGSDKNKLKEFVDKSCIRSDY